ncbi:MAG: glycosyltransferase [Bacteroidales bacterium]|nr:glycosyltransferase [Bacteroidales bacterium]
MRFTFVILHYQASDVTRKCVDNILSRFKGEEVSVVVVDNCSPDGSGKLLESEYLGEKRVHFVLMPANVGFARGNNAGYDYAVCHLDPDFIVVMNNDVFIEDDDFLKKAAALYESTHYAVLGPDIWSTDGSVHQSPTKLSPFTLRQARILRAKMEAKHKAYFFNFVTWNLKLALGLASEKKKDVCGFDTPREGCVLHGACYIFSRSFISKRKYAFNPATFLYTEEDILHYECTRDGLKMLYDPSLKVNHLEDASTKAAYRSLYKRGKMKYGAYVQSLDVLIGLLQNGR